METKFDICFVSFSFPLRDARTINIARLTAKKRKRVCLIAFGDENDKRTFKSYGITFFPIEDSPNMRTVTKWAKFKLLAKKYFTHSHADFYYACDLWALAVARDYYKDALNDGFYGLTLAYDSREIYSALGSNSGSWMKQAVINKLEKVMIKDVDVMVSSGGLDSDYLKKYFGHDLPYYEIKNLPKYRGPSESNMLREKLNIDEDDSVVIYQGEILEGRGIKVSIDAVANLEGVHLVIVGTGPYFAKINNYVNNNNLEHKIHFTGQVPYARLHDITSSADIGLTLFEPVSKSYELAFPNKMFEYAMARIPQIASDLPQIRPTVESKDIGVLVGLPLDGDDIAEKIKFLLEKENKQKYKENCDRAARDFGYNVQEELIMSIFNRGI
jgi:glycosyltransferase involved in cell wall biosynthesis